MTKRETAVAIPMPCLGLGAAMIALIALAGCGEDPVPPDPPEAAEVSISPASATLTFAGETVQFTADVTDQYGDAYDATVSWASSDTDVFTVNTTGLVTAVGDGTGMVTASVGNISDSASVTVDTLKATNISISPDSVMLTSAGETAQFSASVTDQNGDPFDAPVSWSSSDTDVFAVDVDGLVSAVADGSGTVTASVGELSASATVVVDINLPPVVKEGVRQGLTVPMAVDGGPLPWLAATRFEDPDDDVLDLTYTVELSDTSVAWAEVLIDSDRNPIVVMGGRAIGTSTLTTTATDPGGLSASVDINLAVTDSTYTPLAILRVANNRIEIPNFSLTGDCSPEFEDAMSPAGFLVTINGSKWQTRADSTGAWSDVAGTELADGTLCTYTSSTAGEYRLAVDMTMSLDENLEPIEGWYRSGNAFVVVDDTTNQAPVLRPTAQTSMQLSVGGGPGFVLPGAEFSDPNGDPLVYTVTGSDTTLFTTALHVDSLGRALMTATAVAVGSGMITITATDPGGLSAEMVMSVGVDDSGYTQAQTVGVSNGLLILSGFTLNVCTDPIIDLEGVDGGVYTVHSSHWQSRADSTAAWADIDGTQVTTGALCPYETDEPGDYRLVYVVTTVLIEGLPEVNGNYSSRNFFTVASGG